MLIKRIFCLCMAQAVALYCTVYAYAATNSGGFSVDAKAAIVIEALTGRVLFAQNIDEKLPIASTTKIMTSLLALEQNDINAVFEVDEKAIKVEGSSMGLVTGDQASLYTLAQGMLLTSGNDAANATAVRISGSISEFAKLMNQRAAEIGMLNTCFETPSGLDGESHYSTAFDMALLAREALKNHNFLDICSQYRMNATFGNPPYKRWLTNHNKLLNYFDGTIGVKTGFTKKSGRCLVSAAEKDGVRLIVVTLNCPDDWNVHQNLYNRFFPTLELENLADGIKLPEIPVTGGTKPSVALTRYEDIFAPVNIDNPSVKYEVHSPQFLYAPVKKNDSIGHVDIYVDGTLFTTLTLISTSDIPELNPYVEKKGLFEKIKDLFTQDKTK